MAKRKRAKRRTVSNPGLVTARRGKGGVTVSVKVRNLKAAKSMARKMGARKG